MKTLTLIALTLAPTIAYAQAEDAAHRADRLKTAELNSRSPNGYAASRGGGRRSPAVAGHQSAQADYQRRLTEWRRRVAACEAGNDDACE